jgi:dTDP-glucose 4,6-dehydratase
MPAWNLEHDLDAIVANTAALWPSLEAARLFVTGGTGFIGCWLLEVLRAAQQRTGLRCEVCVLSRNPEAFRAKAPHLAAMPGLTLLQGEVGQLPPLPWAPTHIIHAATDASADLNEHNPLRMFDTIVDGTRAVLALAARHPGVRMLFLSSGAVYGQQPWELAGVTEDYSGAPNPAVPRNAYGEAKRAAEMLCAIHHKQFGVEVVTARIFTLLGPYLALGIHFAAGNFIRNAMAGEPVVVNGDGKPVRSYLYAGDLAEWLLHLLLRGKPGQPYNVGSEQGVSIAELAQEVAGALGDGRYTVLGAADSGWNPGRYVPDTARIRRELGVRERVALHDAILRTALWHGWRKPL